MKRILQVFLLVAIAIGLGNNPASARDKESGQAIIKFDELRHDFGQVAEKGGPVSHEFEFVNTGNGNLVILDVRTQCGCTRPEYPKKPIAPGKKGKIKVTYNPLGRPGNINRTATVITNGKPSKVKLQLRGNVIDKK